MRLIMEITVIVLLGPVLLISASLIAIAEIVIRTYKLKGKL